MQCPEQIGVVVTLTPPSHGSFDQGCTQGGLFRAVVYPGARVTLEGDLDISALDALRTALDQALLDPDEVIAIDAAELTFIDSAALSELLRYHVVAAARQRRLHLERVPGPVATVLDALDLRHVLMEEATITPPSREETATCSP
jgi:anti-anti-sigma factor